MKKRNPFSFIYGIFLIAFTVHLILDTFVTAEIYTVVEPPQSTTAVSQTLASFNENEYIESTEGDTETVSNTAESASESEKSVTSTSNLYEDENIKIEIVEYTVADTQVYVADVQLESAEYLKTAFAKSVYGKNVTEKTSTIAESVGAILAINGDYYGVQESGFVLKNGVVYRDSSAGDKEDLVIYQDGSFEIINESEIDVYTLLEKGAYNILSFGPALVTAGEVGIGENYEVARAMSSNPRTAIGIIDENHYVFVVSDGRTTMSEGLTLYELAEFMKEQLGVETAYNLDGGGSSTMYFNGELVNNPTTNGNKISERSVSDIVYIGY